MRVLILAFAYQQQYHVMRLTKLAGHSVYVLGRDCARGLAYSRACDGFAELAYDPARDSLDAGLDEINNRIKAVKADVIVPSDVVSTRLLCELAPRLAAPTCALPASGCFDEQNDKWRFFHFCSKNSVPVPQTWLIDDAAALKAAIAKGELKLPLITKPVNSMSQRGIHPIRSEAELGAIDTIDYKPILVQRFISGALIDISILAHHGKIVAYSIQNNAPEAYEFVRHDKLLAAATHYAAASNYHGVAHLDAVEDAATGEILFLECNPRLWYSVYATALAGLNFPDLSLRVQSLNPAAPLQAMPLVVRKERVLLNRLLKGILPDVADRKVLAYYFADPIGKLCGYLPMFKDDARKGTGSIEHQFAALDTIRRATAKAPSRAA